MLHTPGPWGFRKHIVSPFCDCEKGEFRSTMQEAFYLHGAKNDSDFLG